MYTQITHKRLEFIRGQVAIARNQWKDIVPFKVFDAFVGDGKYSFRLASDVIEMRDIAEHALLKETGDSAAWDAIETYASKLGDAIKEIRRNRKNKKAYAPLADAKETSKRNAGRIIEKGFQRSRINVEVGSDVGVIVEGSDNKWNIKNYVTVGVTWWKTVGLRGFGLINAPSGIRFVLSCRYRHAQYVVDDEMNAWEVRTIGFKHGKAFEETGWLVTHRSTEHDDLHPLVNHSERNTLIPHAYGKHLSKAHSLMKQRTVRHLTKMLDG